MRISTLLIGGYLLAVACAVAIGFLSQLNVVVIGGDLAEISEEWLENDRIVGALAALRSASEEPDRRGDLGAIAAGVRDMAPPSTGEDAGTSDHDRREQRLLGGLADQLEQAQVAPASELPRIEERAHTLALDFWSEDRGRVARRIEHIRRQSLHSRRINLAVAGGILLLLLAVLIWLHRRVLTPLSRLHQRVAEIGGVGGRNGAQAAGLPQLSASIEEMAEAMAVRRQALEQEVENRTEQLRHADRLGGLGRISAAVAHEINNPLGSIGLCVDGLRRSLRSGALDPAELDRNLTTISSEIDRCTATTQKMLTYAHYRPEQPVDVPLDRLLQEAVDIVSGHASRNGVAVDASDASDGGTVGGDPGQLRQVVVNLLLNAVDVSPRGGVVVVEAQASGDSFTVRVHDDGPGVPPELRDRIFEPFFTSKRPGEGTGLGLSISREIVESHGGTLTLVDPAEGRGGAVFEVHLPRHAEERP